MTPDACKSIQLIPLKCSNTLDEQEFQLVLRENGVFAIEGPVWNALWPAVEQTVALLNRLPRGEPWGSYLMADAASREVVGICGFKDAPVNGLVEIAYFTFPPYEGKGYATTAASELTALAETSGEPVKVIARTLMEHNASTRVLTKCGFLFAGEVVDPEDGRVWQWESPGPGGKRKLVHDTSAAARS